MARSGNSAGVTGGKRGVAQRREERGITHGFRQRIIDIQRSHATAELLEFTERDKDAAVGFMACVHRGCLLRIDVTCCRFDNLSSEIAPG